MMNPYKLLEVMNMLSNFSCNINYISNDNALNTANIPPMIFHTQLVLPY